VFNLVEQRHGSIEWNTTLEFDFSTHTANWALLFYAVLHPDKAVFTACGKRFVCGSAKITKLSMPRACAPTLTLRKHKTLRQNLSLANAEPSPHVNIRKDVKKKIKTLYIKTLPVFYSLRLLAHDLSHHAQENNSSNQYPCQFF
jgi:hypothetical protein